MAASIAADARSFLVNTPQPAVQKPGSGVPAEIREQLLGGVQLPVEPARQTTIRVTALTNRRIAANEALKKIAFLDIYTSDSSNTETEKW